MLTRRTFIASLVSGAVGAAVGVLRRRREPAGPYVAMDWRRTNPTWHGPLCYHYVGLNGTPDRWEPIEPGTIAMEFPYPMTMRDPSGRVILGEYAGCWVEPAPGRAAG